jgi:hypothetical protein
MYLNSKTVIASQPLIQMEIWSCGKETLAKISKMALDV